MSSDDQTKHLLNIWPGPVDPLPRAVVDDCSLDGDWFELRGVWSDTPRVVDLPPELYLRGGLDLVDQEDILSFTEAYGMLAHTDWRGLGDASRRTLIGIDETVAPWSRARSLVELAAKIRAEGERRTGRPFTTDALEHRRFFHVDEVRIFAAALRDMTRLRRVVEGDLDYGAAARQWESGGRLGLPPLEPDPDLGPVPDKATLAGLAASDLLRSLNAGLAEFSPRVVYGERGSRGLPYQYRVPPASTYGVLCLQLANHIAEHATYRNCPACGIWFVRKEDPTYTVGSKRLRGVTYCSDRCANRMAKRAQLQRRRDEIARQRGESTNG